MTYIVCPACGGDRDTPRYLRHGNLWGDAQRCADGYHRGERDGYELQSQEERDFGDQRRAET